MNLRYFKRNVYGRNYIYPLEEEFSLAHSLISGRKTLSEEQIEGYEMIGINLTEAKDPEESQSK